MITIVVIKGERNEKEDEEKKKGSFTHKEKNFRICIFVL